MPLLDHLWILSTQAVPLAQDVPKRSLLFDLTYTDCVCRSWHSVFISFNSSRDINRILTGSPGWPASPLCPSTPIWPWKTSCSAFQCKEHLLKQTDTTPEDKSQQNGSFFSLHLQCVRGHLALLSLLGLREDPGFIRKQINKTVQITANNQHGKNWCT